MIQRAEQANIVGLRSKDFVQWVGENIDAPMKRGPGGAVLERLKAGLVGDFFNWAKRNSTWPLVFGIMCCAIEMAATSDPRYDVERFYEQLEQFIEECYLQHQHAYHLRAREQSYPRLARVHS